MNFVTLNGAKVTETFYVVEYNGSQLKSELERDTFAALKKRYAYDIIVYEWHLPGNMRLSIDFFLPNRRLAIECDGQQHVSFNSFFHKSKRDFHMQQNRDQQKDQFCSLNNIELVRITHIKELEGKL